MKLATVRTADGATRAVRVAPHGLIDLGSRDVGELLRQDDWADKAAAPGPLVEAADPGSFAPVVPAPGKVLCVGLNYRSHILEMGRELPKYPTLFAKYRRGAHRRHRRDTAAAGVGRRRLGGRAGRHPRGQGPPGHRGTGGRGDRRLHGPQRRDVRDWQYRSPVWLQGKTWEGSTPFGPYLVTPDELPGGPARPCS